MISAGKFETSHSPLQELINHFTSVLRSARVSPGDVVVLSFPNSIELVIVRQADSNGHPSAQAVASKLGISQDTVYLSDPTGPGYISVPTLNGDTTHGLVHNFSNEPSDGVPLLHNSGTTSRPKVIALTTQHNLATLVQSIPSEYRMTHSDSTVGVLPMFHVHGLLAGLLSALSAGESVTLASLGQFTASTFWGDMHKPGPVDKRVGQELAVLDDKGAPQLTGVAGEVYIRWPNVTKGYKNNPEANEAAFLFGWFHTGHLESEDHDYLHLVGRVKELIYNGGSFHDDHVTADVGVPTSVPTVNQISLPEGSEHNTGSGPTDFEAGQPNQTSQPEIADPTPSPNRSNGIWHLMYTIARNFFSNAGSGPTDLEAGQPNQTSQPEIADPTPGPNRSNGIWHLMYTTVRNFFSNAGSRPTDLEAGQPNQTSQPEIADPTSDPNRSNGIWQLMYLTAGNFVTNTIVGVLYLGKNLQGCNETYQRAELIASVAAPIAVAVGTFASSILFASNPEKWSNWISVLSMVNTGMTVGGPLSFNSVRDLGIEH